MKYWQPAGCFCVTNEALQITLFDTCVFTGAEATIRLIQKCCFCAEDGVLGFHTRDAMKTYDTIGTAYRLYQARYDYYNQANEALLLLIDDYYLKEKLAFDSGTHFM